MICKEAKSSKILWREEESLRADLPRPMGPEGPIHETAR